jgi:hypothetical protein
MYANVSDFKQSCVAGDMPSIESFIELHSSFDSILVMIVSSGNKGVLKHVLGMPSARKVLSQAQLFRGATEAASLNDLGALEMLVEFGA